MRALITCLYLFCFAVPARSQDFTIDWSKCYGGFSGDAGYSICNAFDSSFMAIGYHSSNDGDIEDWHGLNDM